MENSLVSVVVITYNSSATVIETLDSIKNQTYPNIELIVTDDCSKDNTVDICREWLDSNSNRFVSTRLITIEKNTGTSANCNRGWRNSQGEWIKFIAGDDRLLPNCIMDYMNYVQSNKEARIIFSKVVPIGNIKEGKKWPWLDISLLFRKLTHKQIRIILCCKNFLPAPSAIIRKDVLQKLNGYDESIPFVEDWPFWMKAVYSGYKLSYMEIETVEYRFSDSAISQGTLSNKFLENNSRSRALGDCYLRNISMFSRFYIFTKKYANDGVLMRLLHCVNVVNPFFYEYKNSLSRFEEVKAEMENSFS